MTKKKHHCACQVVGAAGYRRVWLQYRRCWGIAAPALKVRRQDAGSVLCVLVLTHLRPFCSRIAASLRSRCRGTQVASVWCGSRVCALSSDARRVLAACWHCAWALRICITHGHCAIGDASQCFYCATRRTAGYTPLRLCGIWEPPVHTAPMVTFGALAVCTALPQPFLYQPFMPGRLDKAVCARHGAGTRRAKLSASGRTL